MASVNARQINRAAQIAGIPPWILRAQVRQESGGRQGAVSSAGASGVEQLMPGTASYESRKHGLNTATPFGNLVAGAFYLREKYNEFKRWDYALAAYNAGSGAVHKFGGIPPYRETRNYVRSIMGSRRATLPVAGDLGGKGPPSVPGANLGSVVVPGAVSPAYTKQDAALQGVQALAEGNYDPTVGLGLLQKAAKATAAAVASSPPPTLPSALGGLSGASMPVLPKGTTKHERQAVNLIRQYLGTPYKWGGSAPGGFDCSGLLQFVWNKVGVQIPRTSEEQWKAGRPITNKKGLMPGDAVFFEGRAGGPGHVGMYIGKGKFIEAPHTGARVRISRLAGRSDYVGARRFA